MLKNLTADVSGEGAADGKSPGGRRGGGTARTSAAFEANLKRVADMPPGPERNQAYDEVIREWAMIDPLAALAAARAVPELRLRADMKEAALKGWAMTDPAAAWDYATSNPDLDLPDNRMDLIIEGLTLGDPDKALAFIESRGASLGKTLERAAYVVDELYERGGNQERLQSWIEQLPQGKMRDATMNRLIDRWARYDPQAALRWMQTQKIPPENLASARMELTESWARVDPRAALAWTERLPQTERSPGFYDAIYRRWLESDRNGAAAWLAQQPPSAQLDRPIENYVSQVAEQNPADTMPWAESITDEKRRWRTIGQVAEHWRKRDAQALERHVRASSQISDDQKKKLLKLNNG